MPLRPFVAVPEDLREWSRWMEDQAIVADDDSVTTAMLQDASVTYAKIQDVTADRILGRLTSAGVVSELTAAQLVTLLKAEPVWELEVVSFTLVAGDRINATAIATAVDATLPGTIAVGDAFIVHNATTSTKVVQIDPATHSIVGAVGTVTSSDTLVLALGETAQMVAVSSSVLEIV